MGEVEELANLASYLVSDYSSWISGEVSNNYFKVIPLPKDNLYDFLKRKNILSQLKIIIFIYLQLIKFSLGNPSESKQKFFSPCSCTCCLQHSHLFPLRRDSTQYSQTQKEAYDRVPCQEIWMCMREMPTREEHEIDTRYV